MAQGLKCSLIIIIILNIVLSQKPNVCHNFIDYYTMNPRNCWYNPEINMETPELIKHNGYPFEQYETATEDGYILTVYRMPKENPKGIIYLQHPASSSSVCWVDKGKNKSLGFILWDNGYDVWIGNFRGTYYSRKHMYLSPDEPKYWNFSFHEHGIYDITTQVDLIVNKTNAKPASISFIGHSMGCTAGVIYAAEKKEHSTRWMKVIILMAPPINLVHTLPIIKIISPYVNDVMAFAEQINVLEVIAFNKYLQALLAFCRNAPTMIICVLIEAGIAEDIFEEIPADLYPIIWSHNPGGLSLKSLIHYGQIDKNGGNFTFYDYGKEKNLEYYHNENPPLYHTQDIETPLFSMVADHDGEAGKKDVDIFYNTLSENAKKYGILVINKFSHVAFLYGVNTREKVYIPTLNFLDKIYLEDDEK